METDVDFPTDINLLLDAMPKVIVLTARVCTPFGVAGWRQSKHNLKNIKKLYRRAQKLKRSSSQDEAKKAQQQQVIKQAYGTYIEWICKGKAGVPQELEQILDNVVLPRKGKLSVQDKEREHSPEFIHARYKHSAVESAINAVENHGLDRCLDHGLEGFKRYVGLAVVARNIQRLGRILQQRELQRLQRRQQQYRCAA